MLKPYHNLSDQFAPKPKEEYEGLGYTGNIATSATSSTPGKMYWVKISEERGKWDHPEAVKVQTKRVTALVAGTSKTQLHSTVKHKDQNVTLGDAEKVKTILGEEEMQRKLAARPMPR